MDVIELEIERMSYGPAAVGRYTPAGESRAVVVFVPMAAPGDRIEAKIVRKHKNYWEAELVQVLGRSPVRIDAPCPIFEKCGGCQWQHLTYANQIECKGEILLHQLSKALHVDAKALREKLTVHPAKNPFGYRGRVQARGDAKGLGFFEPGTHEIAYTDKCLVAHPDIQRAWAEFLALRPLRQLSQATGQFKVEWTRTESGQVLEAINRKHASFGFTQVNEEQNEVLVSIATEKAPPRGTLLFDLYGGNGNLSRRLLDRFDHVVCVDFENAGKHPIEVPVPLPRGLTLVREDVEKFLLDQRWRDWGFERVDCVIADPPRNGMREASSLVRALDAPRILLVSCDPSTLARDLTSFVQSRAGGQGQETSYQVDSIDLVDMFPQTFHMEAVIGLSSALGRRPN